MAPSAELYQRVQARAGTVLNGKWRLQSVIGVGGMAAVYSAVHRNQSRVAIKMLHPELSLDAGMRTRFLREGYVANTVDHSGAVRVFDDDLTPDGAAFLVMELLLGETLDSRAERKGGKLPAGEVLAVADELLDVLAAAHDKGIVHRDIKPDNLFVTREGRLKVLDFGIARVREMGAMQESHGTAAGTFLGTPAFMAPEQARGRWDEVDARSDIWAVGATMFSLLTGRSVHEGATVNEQLVLAVTNRAPTLAQYAPDLPPSVVTVVDRALQHDKSLRWPTVRHMREQLRLAMADVEAPRSLSAPNPWLERPRVEREGATLAASSELISSITGSSQVSPAVTSASRAPPSQRLWPVLLLGGGVITFGLGVVAVLWMLLGRTESAKSDPEPVVSADMPPPASAPLPSGRVAANGDERPALPEPGTPASSASEELAQAPRLATRPRLGRPRVAPRAVSSEASVTRPAPSAKPERTAPSARPAENPFDKRY
jgi:eukaryotic-like serine/threonine-protein kinase